MKLRNLFLGVCSAVAMFAACEPVEENLGEAQITISEDEMSFEAAGGDKELVVTSTRDWKVETDADWVVVSPESGAASAEPQTVTVSVLENTGLDRTADLKFTIGMKSKYLTVTQVGPGGSAEALIIYSNDFDIEKAQNNSGWPYLDKNYNIWDNKKGTGSETVVYEFGGKMSVRTSGKASNDGSGFSHYAGSGANKIFFGTATSILKINKITLDGVKTDFALSFGAQKYLQDGDSNFSWDEFKVYVSNDAAKWVELTMAFPADADIVGDWNLASANFSVPEGTTELGIAFVSTCSSAYSIDDVLLEVGTEAGQVIDFSKGAAIDGTAGGNIGGGSSDATAIYSNNYDKTAASQGSAGWPYLDESDVWKNAAGTGVANVTYASSGVSVRNNANSDGNYSDYAGSGLNNIFFGKSSPYFATKNIALNGATGLTLTFGTEKYSQTNGSLFKNSEFHIYLSNDGVKWVEWTDYTYAGGTTEGRWNVATANFTVPAGTANLSICMQVDAESSYRVDDMKLVASNGGSTVDFSAAVEKDFTAGSTGGGETPTPPTGGSAMTIAEVLAQTGTLASGTTIEGVVISNMALNNLTSKKGMYIQDETAGLQFYLAANHEFAFGDKVQVDLSGISVGAYNGAVQVSGLALDKITKISSGNAVTAKTVTMADFLANKYEGQYIALEGVQVADADLSKTFVVDGAHTSIQMEDAAGNQFVVFSSKYATYGTSTVPQGSGVIKGISSINNGNMQIIFAQDSDYAGLTGTRFDGTEVTPPAGGDEPGETPETPGDDNQGGESSSDYSSSLTWTLGANAYDNTSASNAQTAVVNGVDVDNVLKLGKSSAGGSATVAIPSGVTKIGFYAVGWKGNTVALKCTAGSESKTYDLVANAGATGNPKYTITVTSADYYTFDVPAGATVIVFATEGTSNCRAIIIGLNPVTE